MKAPGLPSSSDPESSESRRIPRRFRRLYLGALGAVAALAIGGQILVQYALSSQRDNGYVVNQAGLQRMLSQRLSLKLWLIEGATPDERASLVAEIRHLSERWQRAHAQLMEQADALASDAAARAALQALFAAAERPLRNLAAVADTVAVESGLSTSQRAAILRDQEIFLPLMDAIVRTIEQSTAVRVARLQWFELGLTVLMLLVLGAEVLLVFRPAVERLGRTLEALEHKRRDANARLESLRHLSGGIAHHFNNILASILGNAELVRLDAGDDRRRAELADAQIRECWRAADIISELVLYSGERELRPHPMALGAWLRGVVPNLPEPANRLPVEVDIREDAVALVDSALLHDAVEGLIANACEATQDRAGNVRVVLSQVVLAEPRPMAGPYHFQLPPGLYACIQIIDRGVGVARGDIDRIFDPYYSGKSFGRGMGLASILGVAHAHLGGIEIESRSGRGTTFSLYLPLSPETPATDAGVRLSNSPFRPTDAE